MILQFSTDHSVTLRFTPDVICHDGATPNQQQQTIVFLTHVQQRSTVAKATPSATVLGCVSHTTTSSRNNGVSHALSAIQAPDRTHPAAIQAHTTPQRKLTLVAITTQKCEHKPTG